MNRRSAFNVVALLLLTASQLVFLTALQAQQQGLRVEGRVANGSPDSAAPVGLAVTLHQEGSTQHDHLETLTDSQGHFLFDNVVPQPFVVYGVSVRYQGALYGTDLNLLDGPPPPLLLEIFETSHDQQILHTTSASVLFADVDKVTGMVAVLEIIQLANDSDYTYLANPDAPMSLLRFGLPPGAESLQVDTRLLGADVVQVDRGFAVLAGIPPGQHDFMYTYQFPYSGTEETFTKSLPFGAEGLRILSPDEVMTLFSEELGAPQNVVVGETPYQLIEMTDVPRGARIVVTLSDLPQATFLERRLYFAKGIRAAFLAPAMLVILMAVLTAFAIIRHRRTRDQLTPASTMPNAGAQERGILVRLISDLEQGYENGEVPAEDYHRRRRVLESRIQSVQGN